MTDIIEKILKLKQKATCESATEAEAEMFAAKVVEMMRKHAIEEHQLTDKPDHKHDKRAIKYLNPWRRDLIRACADACFCCLVYGMRSSEKGQVNIVGRPLNVQACYEMYYFIEKQVILIARALYPKDSKSQKRAEGGLGAGVAGKIQETKGYDQESRLPVIQEKEAANDAADTFMDIVPLRLRSHRRTREHIVGEINSDRIKLRHDIKD